MLPLPLVVPAGGLLRIPHCVVHSVIHSLHDSHHPLAGSRGCTISWRVSSAGGCTSYHSVCASILWYLLLATSHAVCSTP